MPETEENPKEVAETLPKKVEPKEEAPAASTEPEKMPKESSNLRQESQNVSRTNDPNSASSNMKSENIPKVDAEKAEETGAEEPTEPLSAAEDKELKSKNTNEEEEKSAESENTGTNAAPPKDSAKEEENNEEQQPVEKRKDTETATDATADSEGDKQVSSSSSSGPIVSSSKKNRPPYKYDPKKITLRFLFANRDGLTVTVECNPSDTVGEVKGALISVWPDDLPVCEGSEDLRLICMGKGYLMPDSRTLEDCQIPVFKTHPTPINVSVKPKHDKGHDAKHKKGHDKDGGSGNRASSNSATNSGEIGQGCACIIL